jgi:hypothetical protein
MAGDAVSGKVFIKCGNTICTYKCNAGLAVFYQSVLDTNGLIKKHSDCTHHCESCPLFHKCHLICMQSEYFQGKRHTHQMSACKDRSLRYGNLVRHLARTVIFHTHIGLYTEN